MSFFFIIQIEVTDPEETASATIFVMVEETVVDNPPVFSQDSYIFQLAENVEDNYVIGSLGVTDESE